jgi:hypothetical protein
MAKREKDRVATGATTEMAAATFQPIASNLQMARREWEGEFMQQISR